jgi:glycosyltransferase involved in cell wall biosynthesis
MASGLPCVCADATGSRSLVVAEETGYLVTPGSVQGFTGRIATIAADPVLRRKMSEAARLRSLAFGWNDAMSRILGYYEDIVSESSVVVDHLP